VLARQLRQVLSNLFHLLLFPGVRVVTAPVDFRDHNMARQVSGALRQLERQPKPQHVGYLYSSDHILAGRLPGTAGERRRRCHALSIERYTIVIVVVGTESSRGNWDRQ